MSPSVTVIVPAYNAERELRLCLEALRASHVTPSQLLVADDGSTDATSAVAAQLGALVIPTGGRLGPARARNLAAQSATGALLVFFDADVIPHPETLGRLCAALAEDTTLDAVIGSYDDAPACREFLSQYRNLQHCFVHQRGHRTASTFWTGCGAVRREVFLARGGFLESYGQPSIEDIEFGTRLIRLGHRIALDPAIQVKHLKRWTLRGMLRTDIFQRAIPWTELILREGKLPNDLNLSVSQRVSAALTLLGIAAVAIGTILAGPRFLAASLGVAWVMVAAFWLDNARRSVLGLLTLAGLALLWWFGSPLSASSQAPVIAAALAFGSALALNTSFLSFLASSKNWPFALASAPFFLLYLAYSAVTFAIVLVRFKLFG